MSACRMVSSSPTFEPIQRSRFETFRSFPRVRCYLQVSRGSHLNGSFHAFNHPEFRNRINNKLSSEAELKQLGQALHDNWEWTWESSFDDCMEAGAAMMTSSGHAYGGCDCCFLDFWLSVRFRLFHRSHLGRILLSFLPIACCSCLSRIDLCGRCGSRGG